MVFSSLKESLTLIEAAKLLPGRPHANTLRRWATRGYNGVILRTFRVGRRVCTSQAYIEQFMAECSGEEPTSGPVTQSHKKAESALDALGVTG